MKVASKMFWGVLCLLGSASAVAQPSLPTSLWIGSPKQAKIPSVDPPVSVAEFDFVMRRIEDALVSALKLNPFKRSAPVTDPKPVQRTQVIERLDRLYELAKPKFTNTPRPVEFDAKLLQVAPPVREKAIKLIKMGCLGPVTNLVTGSRETLKLEEFGDAVALFIVRISELTHIPSARFSPDLIFDRMPEKPRPKRNPPRSGGQ